MPETPPSPTPETAAASRHHIRTVRAALASVSEKTGVSVAAMLGPSLAWDVKSARSQAYVEAKRLGVSYRQIGVVMCRDASTVSSCARRAEKRLAENVS